MQELVKDLWDCQGILFITTNGFIKTNGRAVMGAGVAKEAVQRIPGIDLELGRKMVKFGNIPMRLAGPGLKLNYDRNVVSFPVKHNWFERADLDLIAESAGKVVSFVHWGIIHEDIPMFLPRPGCGNGGLTWPAVRDRLEPVLGHLDNLYIVDRP
ncbi:MAG: hypothetical protein LC650_00140 [Actinobacteria bacterium]|nr:hypothetical protein [Actinomycetota bacterium]